MINLDNDVDTFMKAVQDPEFVAKQQPISILEADKLRENFVRLMHSYAQLLRQVDSVTTEAAKLSQRIAFLEEQERVAREHYKDYNTFRREMEAFRRKIEAQLYPEQD